MKGGFFVLARSLILTKGSIRTLRFNPFPLFSKATSLIPPSGGIRTLLFDPY
jgi:hypothetical protein